MSYTSVFRFLSFIMLFISVFMLIPLFLALHYNETAAFNGFVLTVVLMVLTAVFILTITNGDRKLRIGSKESILIVSMTWLIMAVFGALPMYLNHSLPTYVRRHNPNPP